MILIFTAISLILSACSSDSKFVKSTELPTNSDETKVDNGVVEESNVTSTTKQPAEVKTVETKIEQTESPIKEQSSPPPAQQEKNEQRELFISPSNHYQLYLNDQFYIIEEEPGIDAICYKENDALFMRIEALNIKDTSFDENIVYSKDFLALASRGGQYTKVSLPDYFQDSRFKQTKGFLVENESEKITLVLLELEDKIVRLTIFDDYITNITDELLKIGSTIQ